MSTQAGDQITVQNPFTNKLLNVSPLFDAMLEISTAKEHGKNADAIRAFIEQLIRNLHTSGAIEVMCQRGVDVSQLNRDLYLLLDTFSQMKE